MGAGSVRDETTPRGLPEELRALVERVVRNTRLWPAEKRDVRAELESHFHEGLIDLSAQGYPLDRCVEMLRDSFGDAATAAKLIRRGKKRGRPIMTKIAVQLVALTLVGAGGTAGYTAWMLNAKPQPKVDYVAQLNAPIQAVPEEQRAWPLLKDVLLAFKERPEEQKGELPMPGDAGWEAAMTWVEANRHLLPKIREAAARPIFGLVYDNKENIEFNIAVSVARERYEEALEYQPVSNDPYEPKMVAIILPGLSDLRNIGRLLVLTSREQIAVGDFDAGWATLNDAHRLGLLLTKSHTLIEQLVGTAILNLTLRDMCGALHSTMPLTPDEAMTAAESAMMSVAAADIRVDLSGERMFFDDLVQYVFTDDGQGSGRLIPGQFMRIHLYLGEDNQESRLPGTQETQALAIAAVHADRKETLERYAQLWTQMTAKLALPLYDPERGEADVIVKQLSDDPVESRRFALIARLLPSMSRADMLMREVAMQHAAAQAVVALALYEVQTGALPRSLDELVPEYLSQLPIDAYSGGPLQYSPGGAAGYRLYSVGRNLVDEGGMRVIKPKSTSENYDEGDIVYWPAR